MKRFGAPVAAFAAALVAGVCSLSCGGSYNIYADIDRFASAADYRQAVEVIRKNKGEYGDKSEVLYNMDMGAMYHYAGEYDSSNAYLFEAEKIIDDLFTESVSLKVLSFIANDNVLPYEGEDFEKVLVNVFLALNYAAKGMDDDALVEARKVDLKLKEYSRKYEGKNQYQEDAFVRYLMGVLYENGGEENDALISYKKSYEAYQTYQTDYGTKPPASLLNDIVRVASRLSFDEDVARYTELGGTAPEAGEPASGGVFIVLYSGRGPIKTETKALVSIPDSSGTTHTFNIALPKFVRISESYETYDVVIDDGVTPLTFSTEIAEDVNAIAEKTLDDRIGLVYLKSGGRALMKFFASEKLKDNINKDDGNFWGNLAKSVAVDLAVNATEQADIRTWRTLPANIQVLRAHLPPGEYDVSVHSPRAGSVAQSHHVSVVPKRTEIVIVNEMN